MISKRTKIPLQIPMETMDFHFIAMICGGPEFGIIQCKSSRTLTIECKD